MNRKFFIKNLLAAGGILAGGNLISSCSEDKDNETQQKKSDINCNKNLSDEHKKSRKEYEYKENSPHEDKVCNNCSHWRTPEREGPCGECEVVKGPINPMGYCNQWIEAPKRQV